MPVGGGGLIAGIASYVKAVRPEVKVIGVEPFEADAMYRSLEAGRAHRAGSRRHFRRRRRGARGGRADVPDRAGGRSTRSIRVSNDEICAAIKDVFDDTRSLMEPAGALAVAGLRAWVARTGVTGRNLVAVLSGANMNFDRLRFVAERAEVGEAREALFGVTIPERPGALSRVLRHDRPARRHRVQLPSEQPARGAHLRRRRHAIASRMPSTWPRCCASAAIARVDLTDDELAKLHIRYMVGGRSPDVRTSGSTASSFPSGLAR